MKRLIILLLLLWPLCTWAGMNPYIAGSISETATNYFNDANIQAGWSFEQNGEDSTSKNNDLTVSGTATYGTSNCVKDGTYSHTFNGSTYWTIADASLSSSFPGHASFSALTVCFWFRWDSASTDVAVLAGAGSSGDLSWNINKLSSYSNSTVRAQLYTSAGSTITITGSTQTSANTNYFVVFTWDGSYIDLWVGTDTVEPAKDATHVSCTSSRTQSTPTGVSIGSIWGGDYKLTGYMDGFGVFNRCLSESEIDEIWAHGLGGTR